MDFIIDNPKDPGNGIITGYAATFHREPDAQNEIIRKGALNECITNIAKDRRVLPFLFSHNYGDTGMYIGSVVSLEEDDYGLRFTAIFDNTEEGQRARALVKDGRLQKLSFGYTVLDAGQVTLKGGRKVRELRKLDIREVSLVLFPSNPHTRVTTIKSGNHASWKKDAPFREKLRAYNSRVRANNLMRQLEEEEKRERLLAEANAVLNS